MVGQKRTNSLSDATTARLLQREASASRCLEADYQHLVGVGEVPGTDRD